MDILERLLGLEKEAATLVAAAETVAGQRTAAARVEAQNARNAAVARATEEIAAAIEAERARLAAERAARNAAYRDQLARRTVAADGVADVVRRFLAGER